MTAMKNHVVKDLIEELGGVTPVRQMINENFKINLSRTYLYQWIRHNKIPLKYILFLCEMTKYKFNPNTFRPDIFHKEDWPPTVSDEGE